jgi:hypothetical protein
MLDEGNTDAIGSERLRALYEDGRLSTADESPQRLPSKLPTLRRVAEVG